MIDSEVCLTNERAISLLICLFFVLPQLVVEKNKTIKWRKIGVEGQDCGRTNKPTEYSTFVANTGEILRNTNSPLRIERKTQIPLSRRIFPVVSLCLILNKEIAHKRKRKHLLLEENLKKKTFSTQLETRKFSQEETRSWGLQNF